ncbi:DUF6542 domain-containing protein [Pseudonocardia sp.]|uniref:DUF6542 domain-containing protein n=1 Tax=Pseudonocardia sp. TaxID=60912 RepID=UPI003D0C77B8
MSSTDGPRGTDAPGADAPREPRPVPPGFPMAERSILPTVLGLPPVAALCVAAGGTGLGVLIDLLRIGTVGWVFSAFYFTGCVLGVAWVRRASLFWPMVAPPLLVAIAVPTVVFLAAPPRPGSGITEKMIAVGAPLVNAFPSMATTTIAVLALGSARILLQPLRPRRVRSPRSGGSGREGTKDAAAAAGRADAGERERRPSGRRS